jgi:hypothetical protein
MGELDKNHILPGSEPIADGINIVEIRMLDPLHTSLHVGYQHSAETWGTDRDLVGIDEEKKVMFATVGFGHIQAVMATQDVRTVESTRQDGFRADVMRQLRDEQAVAVVEPLVLMRPNTPAGNFAASVHARVDPRFEGASYRDTFDYLWGRTIVASDYKILHNELPDYAHAIPMDHELTETNIVVDLREAKTVLKDPEEPINPEIERLAGRLIVGPLVETPGHGIKHSAIRWRVEGPSNRDIDDPSSFGVIGLIVKASGKSDASSARRLDTLQGSLESQEELKSQLFRVINGGENGERQAI